MHDCGFTLSPSASRTAAAQCDDHTHKRSPPRVSGHPGASALRCSAHDLLLFGSFNLKDTPNAGSPLSSAAIDEMHQPQANSDDGQYGLGWWINEQSGYHVLFAQGGTADSWTLLQLVPSEDIAVVVVTNSYAEFVGGLADKILSVLLPKFAAEAKSPAGTATLPHSNRPTPLAGKWAGSVLTCKGSVPITLEIGSAGSVRGQVGKQPVTDLADASLDPSGGVYGVLPGDSAISDAPRHRYVLELNLFLHGDGLVGAAVSRDGDELPHWVKLTRTK